MRNKIVAGNWKMNTNLSSGIELAKEVNNLVVNNNIKNVKVILSPPFTHLSDINNIINKEYISISAQNCSYETKGAFTGEISAEMIKSIGAEYIIIGHSERRAYFKENNQVLNKKVKKVLENNLIPIYCCGETLEEREKGKLFEIIKNQIIEALFDLPEEDFKKVIIAYEPVWAIGTGITATSEQAQEMHLFIRNELIGKFGKAIADSIPILYGGSCKPSNAKELFANPDVDGGLIGGAALNAEDFYKIITSF